MMIEQHNDKLKEILDLLVKKDVCQTDSGFSADKDAIRKIFTDYKIDAVINFAGYKAVGESVQKPIEYYQE